MTTLEIFWTIKDIVELSLLGLVIVVFLVCGLIEGLKAIWNKVKSLWRTKSLSDHNNFIKD
jgi:hypothetical protein